MGDDVAIALTGGRAIPAAFFPVRDAGEPRPAVLVIHELLGLTAEMRRLAHRFSEAGFVALAPDFLAGLGPKPFCMARFARGIARRGVGRPYRQLEAARTWLTERPEVAGQPIGVAGFCIGGGFALLYAAGAEVEVVAPFYPAVPDDEALGGICPVVASFGGRDRVFGSGGEAPHRLAGPARRRPRRPHVSRGRTRVHGALRGRQRVAGPAPADARRPRSRGRRGRMAPDHRVLHQASRPSAAMTADTEAYRRLFESHPVAMAIWDPADGRIVAINDAAVHQYGYSHDEARTLTVDRFVHPDDWPRLRERLGTMPRGHVGGETFRHIRRDGSVVEVEMTGHELLFDGRPCRAVMAIDVSERRRLEEQLRMAQRMEAVGQLAGGIAHDFNNLLMVINGFSELLVTRLPPGDELEAAQQIRTAGDRAAALTKQLLAFGRPGIVRSETLNLADLIVGLLPMLERSIGVQVEITFSATARDPWVEADRAQLEQVLVNLAVNAHDAMPEGGRLSIELEERQRRPPRGDGIRARDAAAQRERHRPRHRRGDPRAGLPAVLHDQGRPRQQRTRAGDGLLDRPGVGRTDLGRRRLDPRDDDPRAVAAGGNAAVRSPCRGTGPIREPGDRTRSSLSRTNPRS